jgi:phosphatidate cytidylyltransferase
MLFVFSNAVVLPKGTFRREILENSGFSAEKNPMLFGFLYEYYFLFLLVFATIIFLVFILGLKKETVRYQMNQFFFTFLVAFFAAFSAGAQQYVSYYGRFWYHFPMSVVSWNDACAYFCGRAFGRTKLIGLSPKKTLEGFLGALICNIILTYFFLDGFLKDNNFWTCAPMRLTYKPFEDYHCQETSQVF